MANPNQTTANATTSSGTKRSTAGTSPVRHSVALGHAAQNGISDSCAVGLVRIVANVERCREGAAQGRSDDRGQAIDQQRRSCRIVVAGELHAFQDLQRNNRVEQAQRQKNRSVPPALAAHENLVQVHRPGQIKSWREKRWMRRQVVHMKCSQKHDDDASDNHGHESRGNAPGQTHSRSVRCEQNHRRQERHRRDLKNSENKSQAEEGHRETCQRAEQRREGRRAAQPIDAKRACGLHDAAHQAREYPHVPGQVRVMRALVDGQHDQRDVGKNRGSVDAERDCGHIVAAGNSRQPVRLPGVKQDCRKEWKTPRPAKCGQ